VRVTVPVRRGDDFLKDERPALIKIDVEGFEVNVINGLTETIRQSLPLVVTEVISVVLERAGSSVADLLGKMEVLGYVGFKLLPGSAGDGARWSLRAIDRTVDNCDVLWINLTNPAHLALAQGKRLLQGGAKSGLTV